LPWLRRADSKLFALASHKLATDKVHLACIGLDENPLFNFETQQKSSATSRFEAGGRFFSSKQLTAACDQSITMQKNSRKHLVFGSPLLNVRLKLIQSFEIK
jgi:hypothetical protein